MLNYILIPIGNLHMEHIIKLGDFIFFPSYFEETSLRGGINISNSDLEFIENIFAHSPELIAQCAERALALAVARTQHPDDFVSNPASIEVIIESVNRAMDILRIELCQFDRPEQLPGFPSVIDNWRAVFILNCDFKYLNAMPLGQRYYDMQPGIGLDISNYGLDTEAHPEYMILNSKRTDEVYLEYRNIVARACAAMHIVNINRSFVHLFSTVERLVGRGYVKFAERKKRMLSFIAESREEFRALSNQYYYFSKHLRTEIIHKGRNLLDFIPFREAMHLLAELMTLIIRFSLAAMNSDITIMAELDELLENGVGKFQYITPPNEFEVSDTNPPYGALDNAPQVFIAEIKNLYIEKIVKLGNVLILPVNSAVNLQPFYRLYVYFDTVREDAEQAKYYDTYDIDESLYEIDVLSLYTADDLEILFECLRHPDIREMNAASCVAIITNHKWLKNGQWSPQNYALFADYLCDNINHAFSYILLSRKLMPGDILPSKAGIPCDGGARAVHRLDERTNELHPIPGRVYAQYNDPAEPFCATALDQAFDLTLYSCLYHQPSNEHADHCRLALNSIVDCLYFSDLTIAISYMFDILDTLEPESTDGNNLKTHILPFISTSKKDYHARCARLKKIRKNYRNPLLHKGLSIYEITPDKSEVFCLFGEIRDIIVSYSKCTYALGIRNREELEEKRIQQLALLELS